VCDLGVSTSTATPINVTEVLGNNIILETVLEKVLCRDCEKESYRCYNGSHTSCLGDTVLLSSNFCRISLVELGWRAVCS